MKQAALGIFLATVLAFPAGAYEFVATGVFEACFFEPIGREYETIWYTSSASYPDPSLNGRIAAVASGGGGRVIAITSGDDLVIEVGVIREGSDPVRLFRGAPGYRGRRLVAAANGTIHVLANNAADTASAIITIAPDGTLVRILDLAAVAYAIDLAADQCTMFVATESAILRFDVCNGTPLPLFANATSFGPNVSLLILPNRDVLLQSPGPLRRFDASGALIRTDNIGAVRSIALSAQGTHLLAANGCAEEVHERELATLADLRTMQYLYITADITMVASSAWTAALGASVATETVPALSPMLLGALAILLGMAAFLRMR
jgi:hypothetical protein